MPSLLTPAEIKPKSFEWRRNLLSFCFVLSFVFYPRRTRLMFRCVLRRYFASTDLVLVNSRGVDCVGGLLLEDKECLAFSGVTSTGSVWRKWPESYARSVSIAVVWLGRLVELSFWRVLPLKLFVWPSSLSFYCSQAPPLWFPFFFLGLFLVSFSYPARLFLSDTHCLFLYLLWLLHLF